MSLATDLVVAPLLRGAEFFMQSEWPMLSLQQPCRIIKQRPFDASIMTVAALSLVRSAAFLSDLSKLVVLHSCGAGYGLPSASALWIYNCTKAVDFSPACQHISHATITFVAQNKTRERSLATRRGSSQQVEGA
jgi:hypothetical protein